MMGMVSTNISQFIHALSMSGRMLINQCNDEDIDTAHGRCVRWYAKGPLIMYLTFYIKTLKY